MKQSNLLANFEYKSYDLAGGTNSQHFKLQAKNPLPLLEVKIDFGAGKLALQADWQFMLQHNHHTTQRYLLAYKKRVQIQMDIFSRSVIDLDNSSTNGLMLFLEGNIRDESMRNACTGMLVLKNEWCNKEESDLWRLVLYIYDHLTDYCEIKFDLPLYLLRQFQMN
jgi:hypothetical protein